MIFDQVLEDYVSGKLPADEFLKWIEVITRSTRIMFYKQRFLGLI